MVGSASVLRITSIYNMVEENMTCFMQRKGENPMVFVLDTNKCLMDMLMERGWRNLRKAIPPRP